MINNCEHYINALESRMRKPVSGEGLLEACRHVGRVCVCTHTHTLHTQLLQGLLCPFLWPAPPQPSVLSAIQDTASDPPHRRSPQYGAYGERGTQSPPLAPLLHFLALGSSPLSPSHLPDALPPFWWAAGGNAPGIEITPLCSKIQPIKS